MECKWGFFVVLMLRLREQIYVNCETAAERLRSQLAQFLSIMVSQTQSKEVNTFWLSFFLLAVCLSLCLCIRLCV